MFDPLTVRRDFPILGRQIHGQPLVYLDNAATTQKPRQVIDAIVEYYSQHNANVHRGVHQLGDESTTAFHAAREKVAHFFGAASTELVVVRNTTDAMNIVAQSWGVATLQPGDLVLSSELEHHSTLVPWQKVAKQTGADFTLLSVDDQGCVSMAELEKYAQSGKLKILCLSHVSNALGSVLPLNRVGELARKYHFMTCIDGAQAASHVPVRFDDWGLDFYAVSAHKMLGPMGIGGLLVKQSLLAELTPWQVGGGMIDEVTPEYTTYAEDLEERFTAGTPDVAGLVGWAAACEYLHQFSWEELKQHDQAMIARCLAVLRDFPEVHVVGPVDDISERLGSVTFLHRSVHAHDVGQVLDSVGVAVRSGHHCTMPLHTKFGWPATVRVSFQLYNYPDELEALRAGLLKVRTVFGTQ